jgi:hypothetical protein
MNPRACVCAAGAQRVLPLSSQKSSWAQLRALTWALADGGPGGSHQGEPITWTKSSFLSMMYRCAWVPGLF